MAPCNTLSLLLLLIAHQKVTAMSSETITDGRRMLIACQDEQAVLRCPHKTHIRIHLANYGRFAQQTCRTPDMETIKWLNTDCYYMEAKRILEDRCNARQLCEVTASNAVFFDACPTTHKYLHAEYLCVNGSFIIDENGQQIPDTTTTTTTTSSSSWTTAEREHSNDSREKEVNVEEPTSTVLACAETNHRFIDWPRTLAPIGAAQSVRMPCPKSQNPNHDPAIWFCAANGSWIGQPDLSACSNEWSNTVLLNVERSTSYVQGLDALSDLDHSTNQNSMLGGDLANSARALALVSRSMEVQVADIENENEKQLIAKEYNDKMLTAVDNLLSGTADGAWHDLPVKNRSSSAVDILNSIVDASQTLADSMVAGRNAIEKNNIMLEVTVVNEDEVMTAQQYIRYPYRATVDVTQDSIQIPVEVLRAPGTATLLPTTLGPKKRRRPTLVYNQIDEKLGDYLGTDRVDSKAQEHIGRSVISDVLSISMQSETGEQVIDLNTDKPLIVTFKTKSGHKGHDKPQVCALWDKSAPDPAWTTIGAQLLSSNRTHTSCAYRKMAHFAVLMDIRGVNISPVHTRALSWLTYIGCSISMLCLFAAVVVYMLMGSLRGMADRELIHLNLCLSLLAAEIVFLFGMLQTEFTTLCTGIAIALHYLFLCAFAWMLLEGFELMLQLVLMRQAGDERRWKYMIAGYGLPSIIVAATLWFTSIDGYVSTDYCWLRADNYTVLAFVVPVCVVCSINFLFLSACIWSICSTRSRVKGAKISYDERARVDQLAIWLRGAFGVLMLLGLTWTFGLLYLNSDTVIFAYIFTALNSLQGTFIFLFHVFFNPRFRKRQTRYNLENVNSRPTPRKSKCGAFPGLGVNINTLKVPAYGSSGDFDDTGTTLSSSAGANHSDDRMSQPGYYLLHSDPMQRRGLLDQLHRDSHDQYDSKYDVCLPGTYGTHCRPVTLAQRPDGAHYQPAFPPPRFPPPPLPVSQGEKSDTEQNYACTSDYGDSTQDDSRVALAHSTEPPVSSSSHHSGDSALCHQQSQRSMSYKYDSDWRDSTGMATAAGFILPQESYEIPKSTQSMLI